MIVRAAIRACAARALHNTTLAGQRVFVGELGQIGSDRLAEKAPFLALYVGDGRTREDETSLLAGGTVDLIVEAICPSPAAGVGESDEGLELTADMLERQVRLALSDPRNTWAARLQHLAGFGATKSIRGASDGTEDGARFVARQITISAEPLLEPASGRPHGLFEAIVDDLRATDDAGLAVYADVLEAALAGNVPDWASWAALVGLSATESDVLGVTDDPEAPLKADVTIEVERS